MELFLIKICHGLIILTVLLVVYGMRRTLLVTQSYTPLKIRMLLLPILLYGCKIYADCDSIDKNRLNKLYNNITRYIFRLRKFDHVSEFSVQIFSTSFENLLNLRVWMFLHKIIVNQEPCYLYSKLEFLQSSRCCNLFRVNQAKIFDIWEAIFYIFNTPLEFTSTKSYFFEKNSAF